MPEDQPAVVFFDMRSGGPADGLRPYALPLLHQVLRESGLPVPACEGLLAHDLTIRRGRETWIIFGGGG